MVTANSGWWQSLLVELYGCGQYESHSHHQMEQADLAAGVVCVVDRVGRGHMVWRCKQG